MWLKTRLQRIEFPRLPRWAMVLLLVGGLLAAFSMDWLFAQRPWELPRWTKTNEQVNLLEVKVKDWADMSIDQKHWYVRGYVSSTYFWWYWLRQEPTEKVQALMDEFFPINEVQLVEMMDWLVWDPKVRDKTLMEAIVNEFVGIRRDGGAPMKR